MTDQALDIRDLDMNIDQILKYIVNWGFAGLIFMIWYVDMKRMDTMKTLLKGMKGLIEDYKKQVDRYDSLVKEIRDVVKENTRVIQVLSDRLATTEELKNMTYIITEKLTRLEEKLFRGEDT